MAEGMAKPANRAKVVGIGALLAPPAKAMQRITLKQEGSLMSLKSRRLPTTRWKRSLKNRPLLHLLSWRRRPGL
jgi:hypothetical protein